MACKTIRFCSSRNYVWKAEVEGWLQDAVIFTTQDRGCCILYSVWPKVGLDCVWSYRIWLTMLLLRWHKFNIREWLNSVVLNNQNFWFYAFVAIPKKPGLIFKGDILPTYGFKEGIWHHTQWAVNRSAYALD